MEKMGLNTEAKSSMQGIIGDFLNSARFLKALCFATSFVLVAGLAASCATRQPTAETQDILLASGFKVVTPSTPAQQALLNKLPRGRVTVVNRKGKNWYVFPDAAHNQAYVGNSNQYQSFKLSY